MTAAFAGFEQPAEEPPKEAPNHALAMKELERTFLFKHVAPAYLAHQEQEIHQSFPGQEDGRVRAFEGALEQEKAEGDYRMLLLHTFQRKETPVARITRGEVEGAYTSFPNRERMEAEENTALAKYEQGTNGFWRGAFLDTNDFRALALDLRARQASRITHKAERAQAYEQIERAHLKLLDLTIDPGRKFEHQCIYLLRRWAREEGIDHLFDVRHALPREDMAEATDFVCSFGAKQFNVQQKGLARDSYREEHNQAILKMAQKRTAEKGARLFVVEPRDLQELFTLTVTPESELGPEKKRRRATLRRQLIGLLGSVTDPGMEQALLGEKPKQESDKGTRLTDAFIKKNSPVPQLVRIGLLAPGAERDPQKIMAAKRTLQECLPEVRKLVGTQEAWADPPPETAEAVRTACTIDRAA